MMTRQQFDEALNRYGGDLARWPQDVRADAAQLMAAEPELISEQAALHRVEREIAAATKPEPVDAAIIGRIMKSAHGEKHADTAIRPTGRLVAWVGAATVAALAIGFVAGITAPQDVGEASIAGLLFDGTFLEESVDNSESIL